MPPGTPYHSFALPYPIRVDNFTDTIDNFPPPYNRPPLHLLTHTHSDHILGLASKSFAYRVVCSPDAKEMLLRHEVYAERSLHDHEYRVEKKKTFEHLKVEPYMMPNGQRFFTSSRDLLHAIPLNTPTKFDISESEAVMITLIDANHCPGSVMFLIEGARGTVLHTGDLRAEPWFLSSIQRNHFLQPYLSSSLGDLRISVARREGTLAEATGLVRTLEAIYLDTACLLSSIIVPSKERAVQGIVELIALFPSSTYFFINTWTWGYEDVLKRIAHSFHCKIHLDRYKHSIYSHGSDPFLCALGTRDAASTRFHACERFDRCSFVDVPLYDYGVKGNIAPRSKEGKKVVFVNAVNMSCARWEEYQASVRRRVLKGENVDSLLVPLSRHSSLPELMNFVTLFRPLRVVPNTLDPSLNGVDWGVMSKMFSGCLSPAAASGSLTSVMAPPCLLTSHFGVAHPLGPTLDYDSSTLFTTGGEEHIDTAYSNLMGSGDVADQWGEKGSHDSKMEVLSAWIGTGKRESLERTRQWVYSRSQEADEVSHMDLNKAGPSALATASGITPRALKRYTRSDKDSNDSSDEGGSDEHARTAWKIFGIGEPANAFKSWCSTSSESQSQVQGALPTPTSSPCLRETQLVYGDKGEGCCIEHQKGRSLLTLTKPPLSRAPMEIIPPPDHGHSDPSQLTLLVSPFVSFNDVRASGPSPDERVKEAVWPGSQPFSPLDNAVLPNTSHKELGHFLTQQQSHSQQAPQLHQRNLSVASDVDNPLTKACADVENGSQVRQLKRRRIGREDSRAKADKEADVSESARVKSVEVQDTHIALYGPDKAQELASKSCNGGAYAPTTPCVLNKDDKDTSRPVMPSALGARGVLAAPLRRSLVPTVTAATTISFPVRKPVQDRAIQVQKAASLGGLGSGVPPKTCVAKEFAPYTSSVAVRTSMPAKAECLSVHRGTGSITPIASTCSGSVLVSPRTAARHARRAQRELTIEKLRRARPDLIVCAQASKLGSASRVLEPVAPTDEDAKMDVERSHQLAENVREALKRGERVSDVLPRLNCLEQWYAERVR